MMRLLFACVALVLLCSCSAGGGQDVILSDGGYPISYDDAYFVKLDVPAADVWWTVNAVLEEYGWPVESADEDLGIIRSEQLTMGTNRDEYACRTWPGATARVDQLRAALHIRVAALPDGTTGLEINADVEGRYVTRGSGTVEHVAGWFPCTSTGEIESEIFDAVLNRFEPLRYEARVFRRGAPTR